MAYTAHKDPEQIKEHFDPPDVLEAKASKLADMIRNSRHMVAFTGAGVSTSAGIPDFRGPEGSWTLKAQGRRRTQATVDTLQAIPTPTHMALVALQNKGILKYLISQNCDGLHRRSGMKPENLSELHGNSNLERCSKCGKEYLRDFHATADYRYDVHDHRTGRKCAKCGGDLLDTVVNFNESLPQVPLQKAFEHSQRADLMLVLGSSLTVSPANEMPRKTVENGGKLAIVNLQKTHLDSLATVRVFAKTDDVMKLVMNKLGIEIPPFILQRQLFVEVVKMSEERKEVRIAGIDSDGVPVTFIQAVEITVGTQHVVLDTEPFKIPLSTQFAGKLNVKLHFMGNYGEPSLDIPIDTDTEYSTIYMMFYNPKNGEWKITPKWGREHLQQLTVHELKAILLERGVDYTRVVDKQELIDLVLSSNPKPKAVFFAEYPPSTSK